MPRLLSFRNSLSLELILPGFTPGNDKFLRFDHIRQGIRHPACILSRHGLRRQTEANESLLTALSRGTRPWGYPWVIERISMLPRGSTILDVGCGSSLFPYWLHLKGHKAIALDFFEGLTERRAGYGLALSDLRPLRPYVKYVGGSMLDIPLSDNSVDGLTCISVMEHIVIDNKGDRSVVERGLSEARRVLKPGGLLVFTYDTTIDQDIIYGWDFMDDIKCLQCLGMEWQMQDTRIQTRSEISLDEDTYFVPPADYIRGVLFGLFAQADIS